MLPKQYLPCYLPKNLVATGVVEVLLTVVFPCSLKDYPNFPTIWYSDGMREVLYFPGLRNSQEPRVDDYCIVKNPT